jgi:hypothetical protein
VAGAEPRLRRPAQALVLAAGVAVVAVLVVFHVTAPSHRPAPPVTLVLTAPPAEVTDPALGQLIAAAAAASTRRSPADVAASMHAAMSTAVRVGTAATPVSTGTIVVDRTGTHDGALLAYLRGASGITWMVVRQPGGRPAFAPVGSYAAAVLVDQPRAYWPLEDPDVLARDYSGRGAHGSYVGPVSRGLEGALGSFDRSARFAGNGGTVTVKVGGLSTRPEGLTTVELWLRPDAWEAAEFPFGFAFYGLYERGRYLGFNTGNSGDLYGALVPHLAGRWHHVVAEFCNGLVRCGRLYVDGRRLPLRQIFGAPVSQDVSALARISGWPAGPGTTYHGGIEQVAVYDHALAPARIRAHFTIAAR